MWVEIHASTKRQYQTVYTDGGVAELLHVYLS